MNKTIAKVPSARQIFQPHARILGRAGQVDTGSKSNLYAEHDGRLDAETLKH